MKLCPTSRRWAWQSPTMDILMQSAVIIVVNCKQLPRLPREEKQNQFLQPFRIIDWYAIQQKVKSTKQCARFQSLTSLIRDVQSPLQFTCGKFFDRNYDFLSDLELTKKMVSKVISFFVDGTKVGKFFEILRPLKSLPR